MQPMLQDMAGFTSRLAQQEAATRATPWAPGPARAAAAMHGAPPHGVDVGASSDLHHIGRVATRRDFRVRHGLIYTSISTRGARNGVSVGKQASELTRAL